MLALLAVVTLALPQTTEPPTPAVPLPFPKADEWGPDPADLAAALATLQAYEPDAQPPDDPAVRAAERQLLRAMPELVRGDQGQHLRAGITADVSRRLAALHKERAADLVPSREHPQSSADPLARVLVRFDDERTLQTQVEFVRPHAAAAAFPGALPAGTMAQHGGVTLDLAVPGRRSLGWYAAPGAVVTLRFGGGLGAPPPHLAVRIGAHSDDIARRPSWPRMPRISRTFAVDRRELRVANAYGGLVYVEVQEPATGTVDVLIDGAVPAPLFELGVTEPELWRERGRKAPAPWAELATDKVVLTVPSEAVRALEDPTELLRFWNAVLDAAAHLATRPRARQRPERYVADLEISAGYMHAGYPIMTHLDAVPDILQLERLQRGPWGLFHELGHNHQSRDWTFAGTGEVTVNLFSLYLCHSLCGVTWDQAWGGNLVRARQRLADCLAKGQKPWSTGSNGAYPDLALRLLMYSQIERGFGWEAFMHAFAEYRDLKDDDRPKTDDDKRDQWLVRLSRGVDRDLGPFFLAWGVTVSEAARAQVAHLTPWMPEDWPLR